MLRKARYSSLLAASEVAPDLDDFAQLHVHALDRVCRIRFDAPPEDRQTMARRCASPSRWTVATGKRLAGRRPTGGHRGDVVRDVMLAAVEQRFRTTQATQTIEWLSENGSAYIDHRTRSLARELGLEPLTTPVRSPQSNGMAESFVKTMKHNYVAYMGKPDAPTALSRLAVAFEHYNERHPHKALEYRSPREFRPAAVSST